MAKSSKNAGWPGFFRLFAVLCAIMGLLAQQGAALSASAGDQRVFRVYTLLTLWAVPALFVFGITAILVVGLVWGVRAARRSSRARARADAARERHR